MLHKPTPGPTPGFLPRMSQTTQAYALAIFLFFQSCTLTIQGDKDLPTPCENGVPTYCHEILPNHCKGKATYNTSFCEPKTTSVCFSTQGVSLAGTPITYTIYNSSGQQIKQLTVAADRRCTVTIPVRGRIDIQYTATTVITQNSTTKTLLHFQDGSPAWPGFTRDTFCAN